MQLQLLQNSNSEVRKYGVLSRSLISAWLRGGHTEFLLSRGVKGKNILTHCTVPKMPSKILIALAKPSIIYWL